MRAATNVGFAALEPTYVDRFAKYILPFCDGDGMCRSGGTRAILSLWRIALVTDTQTRRVDGELCQ